jgi:hypothetical protein
MLPMVKKKGAKAPFEVVGKFKRIAGGLDYLS